MKTRFRIVPVTLFTATLLFLVSGGTAAPASKTSPQKDRAADQLAEHGSIPLSAAGPYVEEGTYRMQVDAKLGAPDLRLADGTWLYHHHQVRDSAATGTLVVRFDARGRVNSLALVTPRIAATLRSDAMKSKSWEHLARR